jgi:cytoskeletal protein CcmA (bactofilin family)
VVPPPVKPLVLLADENVVISGQVNSEGDIHANNDIIFNEGNKSQHTGNLTAVDDIILKKKNKIIGTAAGDDVDNAGTITGGFTENAGIDIIPLPILPDLDVHGADVKVGKKKTSTLDPGDYGKVNVEAKGTLKLQSGEYNLYHLKTGEKAVLIIDLTSGQPITINLDKRLVFGKNVVMQLIPPTASTTLITFNIDEDDDDGDNDEGDVVMLGEGSRVFGNIIAPETSVEIGPKALFKGAICAENIRVKKGARFVHHNSTAAFPKESEESEIEASEVASEQSPVTSYQLEQNYPNPFNPSTKIQFSVLEAGVVQLSVYNLQGQEVRTLVSGQMNPGSHTINWNGRDNAGKIMPNGVYLYKLQVNGYVETRKMTLMK